MAADSRSGWEMFKMSLYHFVMPDSKEATRVLGPCQHLGAILKRFPLTKDGTVCSSAVIIAADCNISNMLKVLNDILKIDHLGG